MSDPGEPVDEPNTVRVPVRRGPGPFGAVEYTDVDEAAAGHWSADVWHAEPPR